MHFPIILLFLLFCLDAIPVLTKRPVARRTSYANISVTLAILAAISALVAVCFGGLALDFAWSGSYFDCNAVPLAVVVLSHVQTGKPFPLFLFTLKAGGFESDVAGSPRARRDLSVLRLLAWAVIRGFLWFRDVRWPIAKWVIPVVEPAFAATVVVVAS